MRVALFVHCFFPEHFYGTETYTLELATNLKQLGHDPIVVSAVFHGEPRRSALLSHYEFEGIPVWCIDKNYLPHTRIKDTYYQPEMRGVLRDLLMQIKPNLVHVTHLINHTAVLPELATELGIPAIATMTDFFGFCYNNKLEAADGSLCHGPNRSRSNCLACYIKAYGALPGAGRLARVAGRPAWSRLSATVLNAVTGIPGMDKGHLAGTVLDITRRPDTLAECYRHYRLVIAPTRFLRDSYVDNGLKVPNRLIHFGVDIPRQAKPARLAKQALRLGFIGQIAPHKGLHLLVEAIATLPRDRVELLVFGPQNQDRAYAEKLETAALGLPVQFRGTFDKNRLAEVFAEIDVLVIPSTWYENSPLVLLDALASHTPVVVANVAGLTEFVEEGRNGFAFRRNDAADLARVLANLVDTPGLVERMTQQTAYAMTTRAMTEAVVDAYRTALG